ncbi:MAG: threonine--tRNA ligase [Candidatus Pacebacteria bacterium]|nr:threonine--tRNA ligase [Candidatus Paceibacterota bacterium]MDD5555410.1 threonine--tRNA ligase [Candidatus Paceibacterota bacterium]
MQKIRHSFAHILALSVKELYPDAWFGTGPDIENGFYYDIKTRTPINNEDLKRIEKKMKEVLKRNLVFKKKTTTKAEAKKIFKDQPFKLEILKELEGDKVSVYETGDFIDLCKGPHVESTKELNSNAFKLEKIAGAYFQGDEKNPMLTRIYGLAFKTEKELNDYLKLKEEAEKRDHRVLGEKLGIFMFDDEVGSGLPLWLPKGAILRKLIKDYLYQELIEDGYGFVETPHIGKLSLWQTSGHWENYRENIYSPIDIEGEKFVLKPMNCPFHVKIFKSQPRSYRELPLKMAEFGTVYRFERSGTLHGLTRVRGFTQDDAHIWCRENQLKKELTKLLKQGLKILKKFGFKEYNIYLSTRPEKYAGTEQGWKKATTILEQVLKEAKLDYNIDPGGGVFYGPKIDIKVKDTLGREWQCTTIQVDFNLPDRFQMFFINEKGEKERPYMIHRALYGSLERFIGVLIEHYAGAFPFWLAPVQIKILPVSDKFNKYAREIKEELGDCRVEVAEEKETISKKIRQGEMEKIPYLLIVGEKEKKAKTVSVRKRGKGDLGAMKMEKFKEIINK